MSYQEMVEQQKEAAMRDVLSTTVGGVVQVKESKADRIRKEVERIEHIEHLLATICDDMGAGFPGEARNEEFFPVTTVIEVLNCLPARLSAASERIERRVNDIREVLFGG